MEHSFEVNIKEIYNHISEEKSKKIFTNRLTYSLTEDYTYINKIVDNENEIIQIKKKLNKFSNCRFIMYGAGLWAEKIITLFSDIKWEYIIDKSKMKSEIFNVPVITYEEYRKTEKHDVFVIATRKYHSEIEGFLLRSGIKRNNIIDLGKVLDGMYKKQYFDLPYLTFGNNEIFIDGGCYDMQTSLEFIKMVKGNYRKIYAYEPDTNNFNKCSKFRDVKNLAVINKGLWSCSEKLFFNKSGDEASKITDKGNDIIYCSSLDLDLECEKVTFIKLDIEGAELQALVGAKEIIKKHKPKIAVCVYHKNEDIWEIPQYLLSLCNDYKFYLRHYSLGDNDTVLYAL